MTVVITLADLARHDHATAVVTLLDAYARDPMGGGEGLSEFSRTHLVASLRQRAGVHVFIAFADDTAAGLAICIEGFSTFACRPLLNIHDFAVLASHRGQGIARGLMAAVEAHALRIGCCKITLEVLEGNRPARELYAVAGFAAYELDPAMGKAMFLQKPLTYNQKRTGQ
jgi:GNAT superfamily N-acetyltransferase